MIHLSLLRNHARWAVFLRNLQFIVVDECHYYRGVFGSNVAMVLRRLLRLCARYTSSPTVIFASATTAQPAATASELIGQSVAEVTEDGSPHGARTVALWEPGTARRHRRRKRRAGAAFGRCGSRAGDGRSDRRGRANADLRAVSPRGRADALGARARLEDIAPELAEQGCVLPCGLSGRGPPRTGTALGRRRIAGPGHHQRAGTGCGHRGAGRGGARGLSGHRHIVLAAGGPFGPPRAERADRADRP